MRPACPLHVVLCFAARVGRYPCHSGALRIAGVHRRVRRCDSACTYSSISSFANALYCAGKGWSTSAPGQSAYGSAHCQIIAGGIVSSVHVERLPATDAGKALGQTLAAHFIYCVECITS